VTLGIIPTGTLNHFAKDLGLSADIEDSIKRVARGNSKWVDVGHINDKIFLNNSSIGIYARIANVKRRTKIWLFRFSLGILSGLWFIVKPPHYRLTINLNDKTIHRTTPIIFIGNNKYDLTGVGLFNRRHIDKNKLSVYVIKTINPFTLITVGLGILIGRITPAYFESYDIQKLKITSKRKKVLVAYDGEVDRLATPISYSIKKSELRVIV
jgi:diacylglycerol kinase family enzyme